MASKTEQALVEYLCHVAAAEAYVLDEATEQIAFVKGDNGKMISFAILDQLKDADWLNYQTAGEGAVVVITDAGKKAVARFRNKNPYFRPLGV